MRRASLAAIICTVLRTARRRSVLCCWARRSNADKRSPVFVHAASTGGVCCRPLPATGSRCTLDDLVEAAGIRLGKPLVHQVEQFSPGLGFLLGASFQGGEFTHLGIGETSNRPPNRSFFIRSEHVEARFELVLDVEQREPSRIMRAERQREAAREAIASRFMADEPLLKAYMVRAQKLASKMDLGAGDEAQIKAAALDLFLSDRRANAITARKLSNGAGQASGEKPAAGRMRA